MKTLKTLKKKLEVKETPVSAPVVKEKKSSVVDIESFKALIDEACLAARRPHKAPTAFSPSALGIYAGKCQRRFVYLFRGVEAKPNFDGRTLRVFENGTKFHERIQSLLDGMGLEHESEMFLELADPPIRAYADSIITFNDEKILLEFKSINEAGFIGRKNIKKAKDEHLAQANIYAYLLGIKRIWVYYENKNNQEIEIFEHEMNPEKAEKQLEIWRGTWKMHQEGKLPHRPYKPTSSACQSCDVRDYCLADPEVGE